MFRSKILISVLVISIVAVSSLVFGLLYTNTWSPSWNPFKLTADEILLKGIKKVAEARTFHSDLGLNMNIKGFEEGIVKSQGLGSKSEAANFNIGLSLKTDADKSDKKDFKSQSKFKITLGGEGMELSVGGEAKILNKVTYFKLTTFPSIPIFGMLGVNIGELKDQWIKIDQKGLEKLIKELGKGEYKPLEKQQLDEMKEKIIKVLQKKNILKVEKKLSAEKVNSISCYHYLVLVDKAELKDSIKEIIGILQSYQPEEKKMSEEKRKNFLQDFSQKFDEFFNQVGDVKFEAWIGKRDRMFHKIKMEKEIDLSKFQDISENKQVEGKVNVKLILNFSDFNKKVKIETPEEFKPVEEILPSKEVLPSKGISPFSK